jgi:cytochrome P450
MTRAVVNETLRLYPPAWVITRRALAEDVVAGHRIPQGALVVMSPWLVHRHPEAWDSPESFDPQRFLGDEGTSSAAYLPFGAGPRLCIGRDFALVEATLMLAHILRAFDVRAIPGHTPRAVASVTLRPEGGLPMLVSGGGAPSGRS